MNNNVNLVRNAINFFIFIALAISLFQELRLASSPPLDPSNPTPDAPAPEERLLNGTRVEGVSIRTTDNYSPQVKSMLLEH